MPTASPPSREPVLDAQVLWWRFRSEIAVGLAIVLLALAGFGVYRFYIDRRANAAAMALSGAKDVPDYEQVINRYPNTPAAASAYLLLAEAQRGQKKFADANATLRTFIDKHPKHQLLPTAQIATAVNLESMGKLDEALATYQQLVTNYPHSFTAPLALISEVPLLKLKNRSDEARHACEQLLTDYRESFWANEAARQLQLLKPAAPPASAAGVPPGPTVPALLAPPPAAPAAPPQPRSAPSQPHP